MTRTLYALLVGIDQYQPPVPQLRGCVNDITAIDTLLRGRLAGQDFQYAPLLLLNADAKRQAVIDGFRAHLSKAGPDDVALFYYSGHGAQEAAPPEFWQIEPDKRDETLVCYDSRTNGRYDLADKELGKLIGEVSERAGHVLVILDCCHSGSGTRNSDEVTVRRAPFDPRPRPIESFIVTPDELKESGTRSVSDSPSGWAGVTRGKPILLAACRPEEEAKEYSGGGQRRGAFSYFLTSTLERTGGQITYRDLLGRISALVRANVALQAPQIEVGEVTDMDRPFLGGAVAEPSLYFTLSHDRDLGWLIDGGAVHGLLGPQPGGSQTTTLALFPFTSTAEQLRDLRGAIGEAAISEVLPHRSTVTLTLRSGAEPDPALTFKAVVTDAPVAALSVDLTGDATALGLVRQALSTASPSGGPSVYARAVAAGEQPRLRVEAHDNTYRMLRPADSYPLTADIAGFSESSARQLVARLEHIARWYGLLDLINPTTHIPTSAIRLELFRVTGPSVTRNPASAPTEPLTGSAPQLEYRQSAGQWQPPQIKVKLSNTGTQRLYCALFDMTELFAIQAGLFAAGGVWLDPGQEAWALDGQPFAVTVPQALWSQGVTQYKDVLKLVVSTEEFDPRYLNQSALDAPRVPSATRSVAGMGALDRLMQRVATRDIVPVGGAGVLADWTASQLTITTMRPQEAVAVPSSGAPVALAEGVRLEPHPSLQAQARLSSAPVAARDLGSFALPPILLDDPNVSQPFLFSTSRSGAPGLSVLELREVSDPAAVTPEQPLVLQVDATLADNEHVLPVGFDGEFFLPLGTAQRTADGTRIALQQLPDPQSDAKSLTGSIKIFFQKVISERLGSIIGGTYTYPLLAAAYIANDGAVTYWTQPEEVQPRVAAAERILLYVHGIIGDTRGMAASVRCAECKELPLPPALIDRYDLILTFDYENINTTIEETARALKQRLEAVGLGPDHGKQLHVVAHSMGGLVSRWFIEREGGNRVVQHLVLLGTPNGGSPWPSVQAWATTALGVGLNSLAVVAWPVKALGTLISTIETIDTTLDQMQPGSDFLKSLHASADPGVPYTIIAGNTSLRPEAIQPQASGQQSRLAALWHKLTPQRVLHEATALAFFGQPNDIAVSVASISDLPGGRAPSPELHQVSCDHITYFTTAAGLNALAAALPDL